MIRKYNVGLVGRGKMGKLFKKELQKSKKFNLIKIISNRNILKNSKIIKNFFNYKELNLIIITSPIKSHFYYLSNALKKQINVITEKPLVENFNQLKKLHTLNKSFKKKVMIHHNDVLNFEKFKIFKKFKNLKKLNKIEMIYGSSGTTDKYKKPFFDWLPHPLSIIVKFFGVPKKFNILEYSKIKKNNKSIENLRIEFIFKNFKIFLFFSNSLKKKTKKIFIFDKNRKEIYDGYRDKNKKTINILLEKFCKKRTINDISTDFKIYELLFKINKKIS